MILRLPKLLHYLYWKIFGFEKPKVNETIYTQDQVSDNIPILPDDVLLRIYDELSDRGFAGYLYNSSTIRLSGIDGRLLAERLVDILAPLGSLPFNLKVVEEHM